MLNAIPLKPHETRHLVPGPTGQLETIHGRPDNEARGVALVCHPDPCQEGTMHNKVVTTLCRCLEAAGYISIRFNYRGVGSSEGEYGHRFGEIADAVAVLEDAKRRYEQAADTIWSAGFSFGSYIAAFIASAYACEGLISVAPSVQTADYPSLEVRCPWTVIQSHDDDVVDPQAVVRWAKQHDPKPQLIEVDGCGHFFHGKLRLLSEHVEAVLNGQ